MNNVKNDLYYITKIMEDLNFIVKHMKNVELEDLMANELLQDSMLFRLIQVSENAKRLSEECKVRYGMIPWTAVYGLRNRIVHDYGSVDFTIVFDTLKTDIPELLGLMEKELKKEK